MPESGLPPTPRRLRLAGATAVVSAFLVVPWFIVTFLVSEKRALWVVVTEIGLLVGSTVCLVFLLLTLRAFVVGYYGYTRTDRLISLLACANVVLTGVSLVNRLVPALEEGAGVVGIGLVIIIGVAQALFGVRLLQLPSPLGGMLRPYCFLNIVTGFCLATLVLLPFGMLTSAVSDIMLGTIFFLAARSLDASLPSHSPSDRSEV